MEHIYSFEENNTDLGETKNKKSDEEKLEDILVKYYGPTLPKMRMHGHRFMKCSLMVRIYAYF